ncbi:fmu domain-containing protein [Nannochloropsis gaditana CCMP526]|nr:fmu domain-containing protein [Nannochloropsis gaditana CCMP526]EKU23073.1 fmu domain-containing protein [Nannochloropsis gaditana CCMP526]|eukprot:XP_005852760.1 fmu domain-containing protein [Nannochloropsis gaditana CCMP526]
MTMDPFRPARAAVDPVVINILVTILSSSAASSPPSTLADAERIANKAIRKRMRTDAPETALTAEERRLIYARVYGVEVLRARLSFLLEHAVAQSSLVGRRFGPTLADFGLPMDASGDPMLVVNRAECLLALYMLTEEVDGEGRPPRVDFLDSDRLEVLGAVSREGMTEGEREALFDQVDDPSERLAARRSLPSWLAARFLEQLGKEGAEALALALNRKPPTTLRVNTLKTSREKVVQELKKRGVPAAATKYSPWGVTVGDVEGGFRVFEQDMYKLGYVDLINEASQCVALSTGAKPYDIVLLYGARKGAKALALGSMLRGNGMIYLWEPYLRQHYQLREAIRRGQAQDLMEVLPNVMAAMRIKADVVLVDALCSNTGALSHHPSMRWLKNETHILETLVPQQRSDLQNAARAVSPGGVLLYSTCSLLACENQEVVAWFESTFSGEFEPLPFDKTGGPGGNCRALLPHVHGVDGTFIARWRRKLGSAGVVSG